MKILYAITREHKHDHTVEIMYIVPTERMAIDKVKEIQNAKYPKDSLLPEYPMYKDYIIDYEAVAYIE